MAEIQKEDTMTTTNEWVRALVQEVAHHDPLKIGWCYWHNGRTVVITGGQYWGERGISNFWDWCPILDDGTLGPIEMGYDTEGAFTPIGEKHAFIGEMLV